MAVGAVREKATPKRLGGVPQITLTVSSQEPSVRPSGDRYVPGSAKLAKPGQVVGNTKPATAKPEAEKASQGPKSEAGKLAEQAWAGTLGVGAGGFGYFLSKTMMNFVKDLGPLTFKNVIKGQMVGGIVAGLPFTLIGDSFGYKKGEVSAQRYWGNVVSGSLSFGLWGVGAMAAAALLPVGGFLGVAAGLAAGGLVSSIFDKTLGRNVSDAIATGIPAGGAKKAADFVVKFITNPIEKGIVEPVKRNWKTFMVTGGAAGIYFGVRGHGKEALKGVGAMVVSAVPQMLGDSAISSNFPMKPIAGIDAKPGAGQIFNPEDGRVTEKPTEEEAQ